ncbi:Condensin complex subunit 1 [Smittium culicis]|uniref:Condensin complex subunit 1 n=1 Tax=Smittium culicis TaxID=133412 RepID=A0A1R1YT19_9FUNG|nr:Condensin complex subunit 1 [Smittium culicis]
MFKLQQRITELNEDADAPINPSQLEFYQAKNLLDGFEADIQQIKNSERKDAQLIYEKSDSIGRYTTLLLYTVEVLSSQIKSTKKSSYRKDNTTTVGSRLSSLFSKLDSALLLFKSLLQLNQNRIWDSTTEKNAFISTLSKFPTRILETSDFINSETTKYLSFDLLIILSRDFNYLFTFVNILWQDMKNYEHFGEITAELITMSMETYDHVQLGDEILRIISSDSWGDVSDKAAQKYIAKFLISLSVKAPKLVTRFMNMLVNLLGSESYFARSCIIEVLGNLINYSGSMEQTEQVRNQLIEYFDIIEQRFGDSHYIVRAKVLQVCQLISTGKAKFPKQRPRLMDLAISRLEDKASNVRRNAIKAILMFLETHPFNLDGGELDLVSLNKTSDFINSETTKYLSFDLLIILSRDFNYLFTFVNILWQDMKNYEHFGEITAELITMSMETYDHVQLGDEILRIISSDSWGDVSDKAAQKYIAKFLISLSVKAPKLVTRFMNMLVNLLGSESYFARSCIIEVLGNLINYSGSMEQTEQVRNQLIEYFDIIEQRFGDSHYIVRAKVLQVCQLISTGKAKFPKQRPRLMDLAISRLEDKASNVRRNAIKAILMFLETHPFNLDGGELDLVSLNSKVENISNKLQVIISKITTELENDAMSPSDNDSAVDLSNGTSNGDITSNNNELNEERELAMRYKLEIQYYQDAIHFVKQLESAIHLIQQLLLSTNRQEVISSIKFISMASRYKIAGSEPAIRKLMHLVYQPSYQNISLSSQKDPNSLTSSFEYKVMQTLYDTFLQLYLSPVENLDPIQNTNRICQNLLDLVNKSSLADLASLEKILVSLMQNGSVNNQIIQRLLSLYQKSSKDRRGAIVLLSMLSKAAKRIVGDDLETFLGVGLGKIGQSDFMVAKYTCDALQSLTSFNNNKRFNMSNSLFGRLEDLLLVETNDPEWFLAAQSAINAVYSLGDRPGALSSEILKKLSVQALSNYNENMTSDGEFKIGQLLFVVGHVSIKEIELLEVIESDLKRNKSSTSPSKKTKADELDIVAGTVGEDGQPADDDIGDIINNIRDTQLLLINTSNKANSRVFTSITKTQAIVALCKMMCVSFDYCESNLPLLLSLMKSQGSKIDRANIAIALGDISICFNRLVGENLGFLYGILTNDKDIDVKRTMLMVLTHLILNGMIKIKSHLGELAICLEDPDVRISQLTKLFFHELASKSGENVIYNNIPDIISTLSFNQKATSSALEAKIEQLETADELQVSQEPNGLIQESDSGVKAEDESIGSSSTSTSIDQARFEKIVRFLFQFIKDKQSDNIVEKLLLRYRSVSSPRQAYDLTFCLSQLNYKSDKPLMRLISMIPAYQQFLVEPAVYRLFGEIVTKAKQAAGGFGTGSGAGAQGSGIVGAGSTGSGVSVNIVSELENKLKLARDRELGNPETLMDVDVESLVDDDRTNGANDDGGDEEMDVYSDEE